MSYPQALPSVFVRFATKSSGVPPSGWLPRRRFAVLAAIGFSHRSCQPIFIAAFCSSGSVSFCFSSCGQREKLAECFVPDFAIFVSNPGWHMKLARPAPSNSLLLPAPPHRSAWRRARGRGQASLPCLLKQVPLRPAGSWARGIIKSIRASRMAGLTTTMTTLRWHAKLASFFFFKFAATPQ